MPDFQIKRLPYNLTAQMGQVIGPCFPISGAYGFDAIESLRCAAFIVFERHCQTLRQFSD